jgi:hypothetical protein
VDQIVDAYHAGLVFDERDIRRIINTNLNVMWNGDREKPLFRTSNISHVPERKPAPDSGYPSVAGALWTGLLDFSRDVRDLYALRFRDSSSSSPDRIVFEKLTQSTPPGFTRKYAKGKNSPMRVDFTESPHLNMAVVMPQTFSQGAETLIVCKAWAGADSLEIALYSKDGRKKIRTLERTYLAGGGDGLAGIAIFPWDGSDPEKKQSFTGDYRIRWTFGGEYREFPVKIQ